MAAWSRKRRALTFGGILLVLFIVLGIVGALTDPETGATSSTSRTAVVLAESVTSSATTILKPTHTPTAQPPATETIEATAAEGTGSSGCGAVTAWLDRTVGRIDEWQELVDHTDEDNRGKTASAVAALVDAQKGDPPPSLEGYTDELVWAQDGVIDSFSATVDILEGQGGAGTDNVMRTAMVNAQADMGGAAVECGWQESSRRSSDDAAQQGGVTEADAIRAVQNSDPSGKYSFSVIGNIQNFIDYGQASSGIRLVPHGWTAEHLYDSTWGVTFSFDLIQNGEVKGATATWSYDAASNRVMATNDLGQIFSGTD